MSESEALERRYRRLLACYPASHRALHGEEMIGVLLAAAPPGRRRPAIADAVDLIWGGLQTRIRTRWLAGVETSWPDAFAVASIIIPVLLVIYFGAWMWLGIFRHSLSDLVALLFAALPPMLALRGYRRAGALTALIPVVFLGFIGAHFVGHPAWISGQVAGLALAFLLTAGAIAFSAGPSRGLHIMTARTWIVVCGTGLAVVAREAVVGRLYLEPAGAPVPGWWVIPLAAAAAAAALGLMLTLPSRVGIRLLILLAIPAYPSLVSVAAGGYASAGQHDLIYLPTLALLGLAAVRAWQSRSPDRSRTRPG